MQYKIPIRVTNVLMCHNMISAPGTPMHAPSEQHIHWDVMIGDNKYMSHSFILKDVNNRLQFRHVYTWNRVLDIWI